jgi:formamidopyrimidine-DNA glycosylase
MPELPEVETMRRGIAHLVGGRVVAVDFPRGTVRPITPSPPPAALAALLRDARLEAVHRFGKRLALEFTRRGATRWLVLEPRMTGLLVVLPPPTATHTRMLIHLADAADRRHRLAFWDQRGLGTIRLVTEAGLQRTCGREVLGPDGTTISGAELRETLGQSRRAIKVALLDQRAVAGIGNIYASEILHRAGIDPRLPCRRATQDCWSRIADATRRILAAAIRCGGSSIGDELYRTPTLRPGRFQRHHRVYGLTDRPCRACGTAIRRIVQAQRSTFFCPLCQQRTIRSRP